MKKLLLLVVTIISLSLAVFAQTTNTQLKATEMKAKTPAFRANKDQITAAQKILSVAETGKMDDATRDALKKYQSGNGLRATGTLNRATLEKMSIALTDKQKEIPVSADSLASSETKNSTEGKKRGPVFRATKDQILQAQKRLKEKGMYAGEANGELDAPTRAGLKAFQEASGMKATGTLNPATLEKMGIALTDKQKENFAAQ